MFHGMKSLLPVAVLALALAGLSPSSGGAQTPAESDDEVLVKRNGTWKAVASHVSGVKPKPEEGTAAPAPETPAP